MHAYAALITLLNVLLIGLAMFFVGRTRGLHGVHAPAVTGHPDFERAFRAHQNTLEQTVMFLPVLWLASLYGNERIAAGLGLAWIIGRLWYLFGYLKEAGKRSMGFLVSFLAFFALFVQSAWSVVARML
jgi:glutathione S-transferase